MLDWFCYWHLGQGESLSGGGLLGNAIWPNEMPRNIPPVREKIASPRRVLHQRLILADPSVAELIRIVEYPAGD